MNILVTGGAGFIGSAIVDEYIAQGHSVVVLDNLSTVKKHNLHPKAHFYHDDIRSAGIESILKKEHIEVINHHAAQINVRTSVADPVGDAQINIEGAINILESARRTDVKKIIFASSGGAIYGDASTIPTPEEYSPVKPASPYGIGKYTVEHYLRFFHETYNLNYTALRYSNVYGPRQNDEGEAGVIALFLNAAINSKEIIIYGDGTQIRDFVFVEDVVKANCNVLISDYVGECNIGTGIGTDINSVVEQVSSILGTKLKKKYQSKRPGEVQKSILDRKKAQKVLHWQPSTEFSNGLEKTYRWFEAR